MGHAARTLAKELVRQGWSKGNTEDIGKVVELGTRSDATKRFKEVQKRGTFQSMDVIFLPSERRSTDTTVIKKKRCDSAGERVSEDSW